MKKWVEPILSLVIFYLSSVMAGFIAHKCGYRLSESIWASPITIGGLTGWAIICLIRMFIKKRAENE
jgi:hypothetical protein